MCDQTPIEYKDGDIVWVKLNPCWWPGEVQALEKLPQEWLAEFKKRPIAAVKFFDEDTYEYVKSIDKIYSYNCTKKNDFIKKGLDLHRAKNAFMEKFPADVSTAEKRTDGDPSIIESPIFTPEKKPNIASLIFGSPSKPKRGNKRSSGARRSSHTKTASPGTSSKATPTNKLITHPRFLGHSDDHEVRILLQSPEKTQEESNTIESSYNCTTCGFTTTRIDVIILHNKSHIQGVYSAPTSTARKIKKPTPKKGKKSLKMTRSKTTSIVEDLALIEKGIMLTTESSEEDDDVDDEWDEPKPKRRRKKNKRKPKKVLNKKKEPESKIDIRDNLLAEWEDDSEGDENNAVVSSTTGESDASISKNEEPTQSEDKMEELEDADKSSVESTKDDDTKKEANKSCFDFEEEEEERNEIIGTSVGRKIPRVIPPSDKPKTADSDEDDTNLSSAETEEDTQTDQAEKAKSETPVEEKSSDESKSKDTEDETSFKDILSATTVPDLPEMPHSLKFEQNFHETKTIKFPDKSPKSEVPEEKADHSKSEAKDTTETSAKLINPKKRFVKSFEDFEQQLNNEQKKLSEMEQSSEKLTNVVELSKLKTQLMSKLVSPHISPPKESAPRKQPKERRSREQITDEEDEGIGSARKKLSTGKTSTLRKRESPPKNKSSKENETSKLIDVEKAEEKPAAEVTKEPETVPSPIKSPPPTLTRRLSVKTPEIKETLPLNIEETTELFETQENTIKIEKAELSEEKESTSMEVVQMEDVLTEVQETISEKKESDVSSEDHTIKETPEDSSMDVQHTEVMENSEELPMETSKTDKPTSNENADEVLNDSINNELNNGTQQYIQNNVTLALPETSEVKFRADKESEDLSALTTLATISELTTNFDIQSSSSSEKSKLIEGNLNSGTETHNTTDKSKGIESYLTFVTEDDLADGQVEIADVSEITKHTKPVTLTSFSVDFADTNTDTNNSVSIVGHASKLLTQETSVLTSTASRTNKRKRSQDIDRFDVLEKSPDKVFVHEEKVIVSKNDASSSVTVDFKNDIESQLPSLIACSSVSDQKLIKPNYVPEYTSSSKLLEILTDSKPKLVKSDTIISQKQNSSGFDMVGQANKKIDSKFVLTKEIIPKNLPKFDPKNSKFVIKSSTIPGKTNPPPPAPKSSRPIILSERIIKPVVTTELESVSVQKVTSKRTTQDIEDIDTFIIKKPTKRIVVSSEVENKDTAPVISNNQPIKKPMAARGKAKILQQTIIKPTGDIHTTSIATTSIPQTTVDDGMFDINSMPIVLGDQILTAENIENMPVVLSDTVQSTTLTTTTVVPTTTKNISATSTIVSKPQSEQVKLLNKTTTSVTAHTPPMLVKTYSSQKFGKNPRIYQTSSSKLIKNNPAIITRPGKPDKFIIVPPGSSTPTGSKYTVGKRPPVLKRSSPVILPTPSPAAKIQSAVSSEPSGNKIMIVTNQQGQQSRVLLTPAQQKLFGYQPAGSKLVKNTLKGNILQKVSAPKSAILSASANVTASKISSLPSHALISSKGEILATSNQNLITSDGQVLVPIKSQLRTIKTTDTLNAPKGRKIQMQTQKVLLQEGLNALKGTSPGQQKTIVIKNQQGQIVKKIQGTDDALLEQQVAEQVQAIKASGSFAAMKAKHEVSAIKPKPPQKRSYPRKPAFVDGPPRTVKSQIVLNTTTGFASVLQKSESPLPPLAPISPKRTDSILSPPVVQKTEEVKMEVSPAAVKQEQVPQKPLNQLIIQDAHGNQTTITEGQILALPSETIDGQPQSYMLVTLDESGNLAPLNNEALLSLDPNLCLGGDLSNMVLQIDDGSAASVKQESNEIVKSAETSTSSSLQNIPAKQEHSEKEKPPTNLVVPVPEPEQIINKPEDGLNSNVIPASDGTDAIQQNLETVQTVTCSIGNDPNQQLIITGDPISTQKFIESLTEGNPDLANLLASAEGNILIQTDEQQILINTDAENQVLLPMNSENMSVLENSEGDGNPIFATQPAKNQDILAAALADTDVFQPDQSISPTQSKMPQSQLSPNSGLYPGGVSNVLGTTLSLSSPIMTPLEVPSSNNKKIPDEETDILTTEVPKNVDLPITITDPNISQTVAQQQVASLIANELSGNLDLPLTITDQGVPLTSAEINSPSFVYSLPALDESVDIHQKPFSGPISMPLLTEEPQEVPSTDIETSVSDSMDSKTEEVKNVAEDKEETPTTIGIDLPNSSVENLNINSPCVEETNTLFESSSLPVSESEKLETTSGTFLGTTLETEEGLCTLGGAICSSLSEPPPDMFDLSVVNRNFGSEAQIKEQAISDTPETSVSNVSDNSTASCPSKSLDCNLEVSLAAEQHVNMDEYDKFETYDGENRNDSTPSSNIPLNSESSSPAVNIDENSCEIPVQPQIVTDLSSSSSFEPNENTDSVDYESNKRIPIDEGENQKLNFD